MQDTVSEDAQRQAAHAVMFGSSLDRTRIAASALRSLLKDPNDTTQVFRLGMAVSARGFPRFFARFAADESGATLLRAQPSIDSAHVDFAALRRLPASTLGGAYGRYLEANALDPDMFQAPPALPSMIAYVTKRIRQQHDIWHVVTGYNTDIAGEIALQGFTYAQMELPSSLLISVFGSVRWLQEPRIARMALDGYRRGRKAAWLPVLAWESMWERDLEVVRRELRVVPASVQPVHLKAPVKSATKPAVAGAVHPATSAPTSSPSSSSSSSVRTTSSTTPPSGVRTTSEPSAST